MTTKQSKSNYPIRVVENIVVLNDSLISDFDDIDDLTIVLRVLKDCIKDIAETTPLAAVIPFWPPAELVFNYNPIQRTPLVRLYLLLKSIFEPCGYPLTAVIRLSVVSHSSKHGTALSVPLDAKLYPVH